jgi:hypothetical protein
VKKLFDEATVLVDTSLPTSTDGPVKPPDQPPVSVSAVVGIVIGSVAVFMGAVILGIYLWRRPKNNQQNQNQNPEAPTPVVIPPVIPGMGELDQEAGFQPPMTQLPVDRPVNQTPDPADYYFNNQQPAFAPAGYRPESRREAELNAGQNDVIEAISPIVPVEPQQSDRSSSVVPSTVESSRALKRETTTSVGDDTRPVRRASM